MDIKSAGEARATTECKSMFEKGHMVYLIDSDEEAIVNFVKDHEELLR